MVISSFVQKKNVYNILRCWSPGPNEIQVITVYDGAHKR